MGQPWEDAKLMQATQPKAAAAPVQLQPWEQAQAEHKPGFVERVGSDWSKRRANVEDISARAEADGRPAAETAAQIAGQGMGVIGDVTGQALKSGYETVVPQGIQNAISGGVQAVAQSPVGQIAGAGAKAVGNKFNEVVPEGSRLRDNLAAAGNTVNALSMVLPAAEVAGVAAKGTGKGLEAVGSALTKSGNAAADAKRVSFLHDLITPKVTPGLANDMAARSTEKGLLRTRVAEPSPSELSIIDTLHGVDVSPMKSLNANRNIIETAKNTEAERLASFLKANDAAIPDDAIINTLGAVQQNLAKSPYLTTNGAETAVNRVINGALETINKNPQTAAGMLQARKDFDAWVQNYKKNAFDPAIATPVTDAVQGVRQSMNQMIADTVPEANVKASLSAQSNMYRALDAIDSKGGSEGKNIITRAAQKGAGLIPAKTMAGKAGVIAGGAAGGALAHSAVVPALGLYGAAKVAAAPVTRQAAGAALTASGKTLQEISKMAPQDAINYLNSLRGKK